MKVSSPLYPTLGVYVKHPLSCKTTVPCNGISTITNFNISPSASVAVSCPSYLISLLILKVSNVATGTIFTCSDVFTSGSSPFTVDESPHPAKRMSDKAKERCKLVFFI